MSTIIVIISLMMTYDITRERRIDLTQECVEVLLPINNVVINHQNKLSRYYQYHQFTDVYLLSTMTHYEM